MSVLLAAASASLFSMGTYLVLQRKLSRIIIGLGLLSHGANLLFLTAGRRGLPAIIGAGAEGALGDPLPQALMLTAIVITFGATAFLLALAYRSWLLTEDDEVEHDLADLDILLGRGGDEDDDDLLDRPDANATADGPTAPPGDDGVAR